MLKQILLFPWQKKSGEGYSLASPETASLFGVIPSASGVSVSPASAMRCPTVYACVKIYSESVAQLPLILYERKSDGTKDRAKQHPLYEILHSQTNDFTDAFNFRLNMQRALCLHGGAFAKINRNTRGQISELIQIPSENVTVDMDPLTLEPMYKVTDGKGNERSYSRKEIFHLRGLGDESPISLVREAIALSILMEEHASKLFAGGARPAGVLKYAKSLSPEAQARLSSGWRSLYGGRANAGKTAVLVDGVDFQQIQFSSVDSQFLEMRLHQIAEIARAFRVPLHMLQDLERTTHANAESLGQQFVTLSLMPWLKTWEGAIRTALLTPEERKTYYAEFLVDDLVRADLSARMDAFSKAVTNGILSPNEVRAAENRAPYEGGDVFRLPMNTEDADGASDE